KNKVNRTSIRAILGFTIRIATFDKLNLSQKSKTMVRSVILVGIGGGIGSICRYLISWVLTKYFSASFPWGTFISNFLGCLIIGIFMGVLLKSSSYQHEIKLLFV